MFFAALLQAAMDKPSTRAELALRLAVLDDWDRNLTAGVIADLARTSTDG